MKLNHIDLQVPDVQAAVLFFERHFAFTLRTSRTSPALAVLEGDGMTLVLQRIGEGERFPEKFHVGFLHEDDEAPVLEFQRRAREEGLDVSDVIRNSRGTLVYCRTPFGILVEVSMHPRRRD